MKYYHRFHKQLILPWLQMESGKTQRTKVVDNWIIFPESPESLSYDERGMRYKF